MSPVAVGVKRAEKVGQRAVIWRDCEGQVTQVLIHTCSLLFPMDVVFVRGRNGKLEIACRQLVSAMTGDDENPDALWMADEVYQRVFAEVEELFASLPPEPEQLLLHLVA